MKPIATCHLYDTCDAHRSDDRGACRVLVGRGGGSLRSAPVGVNPAAPALANGRTGIVVHGCVRDAAELAACAIGIRALASCPMPPAKRGADQRNVPVRARGVASRPGNWLCADDDGIVVFDRPWGV